MKTGENAIRTNKHIPLETERLDDRIIETIYKNAEQIAEKVVRKGTKKNDWDRKLDDILTSRWLAFPVMLLLLGIILWVTITGANYPSQVLAKFLFWGEEQLTALLLQAGSPEWLHGFLVLGVYRCLAWVISVMLPPIVIFFLFFTLLEDTGYLPRVAFNMDDFFRRAGCHGKQALTMCMGFGCNVAGVMSCRIIDSPREKLIAVLTNNFVPCNGRFPMLIVMAAVIAEEVSPEAYRSLAAAAIVGGIILTGVIAALTVSRILSRTVLKGIPSFFVLELPPYRKPLVGQVIVRSIFDKVLFALGRATVVAAPAGAAAWILANTAIGGTSILSHAAAFLDPLGRLMGVDGIILMAFILGLPANETVLPFMMMGYLSTGAMIEVEGLQALRNLLVEQNGWTWITALCVMLFSLLHYPCGTTLITIYKETRSFKWTFLAVLIPLGIACFTCLLVAQAAALLELV